MHTTSQVGLALLKSFEGFVDHQYDDGTGTTTIGYGFIASDFSPSSMPKHMSESQASVMLAKILRERYEPAIHALKLPLNQHQFDSLVSFVFNLGVGEVGAEHTIGAALRKRDWKAVSDAFPLYSDPGTAVHAGLLRRRLAEQKLWNTPV